MNDGRALKYRRGRRGLTAPLQGGTTMLIMTLPIDQLLPADYNPRKNLQPGDPEYDRLKKVIEEFGLVDPLVWNARSGRLVGGHQRLKILKEQGVTEVEVSVVDLDDAHEKALNAALNQTGGDWDDEKLRTMLAELEDSIEDIELTGFSREEVDGLFAEVGAEPGEVKDDGFDPGVAAEIVEPVSKPGDLWALGRHRLICGDATDAAAWDAVKMDGVGVVFTSPPYGVGDTARLRDHYEPGKETRSSLYQGHDDGIDDWLQLMRDWTAMALAHMELVVCNVQMLAQNKRDLIRWAMEFLDHLVDVAVWDKKHGPPQMQDNVLTNAFEWVFLLGKSGATRAIPTANFHGTETNVADIGPLKNNEFADVHRAVMPVELAAWAVRVFAAKADYVVDPFGGVGTTMIAAEQLSKPCGVIELSPRYCDVIIKRWETLTGQRAELITE
jgi:DNA modification methylase